MGRQSGHTFNQRNHHISAAKVFEVIGEGAQGADDRVRIRPGLVFDALTLDGALA